MRKILVTGGAGFIGSHFVRYVLAEEPDVEIVNLDALTYAGNLGCLAEALENPRHHFVKGSITDRDLVRKILAEHAADGIVNFAAETHVDRSIAEPEIFFETNVRGTLVLLQAGQEQGIHRYLQVSTDEVYGSLGADGAFREDSPIQPNSPYSASKTGADHMVRAFHHTYGMSTVISRCSNNYGPYQFPEKMVPLMINNARNDKPLPVYGDGQQVRDWLYVRDHCAALWLAFCKGQPGEVYNIGGNNERANLQVVKLILERLGKPESLIRFVKDRPGHDRRYAIDATKIRTELGWTPKTDFETGIASTIQWYLDNQKWLDEVVSGAYQQYYDQMYGDRGSA